MDNLYESDLMLAFKLHNRDFDQVVARLDALMMVLKSCKGSTCIDPWAVLHPTGDVKSLKDALAYDFDVFYKQQPKVHFDSCELGYIKEAEGPQYPNIYDEVIGGSGQPAQVALKNGASNYGGHWSWYT